MIQLADIYFFNVKEKFLFFRTVKLQNYLSPTILKQSIRFVQYFKSLWQSLIR